MRVRRRSQQNCGFRTVRLSCLITRSISYQHRIRYLRRLERLVRSHYCASGLKSSATSPIEVNDIPRNKSTTEFAHEPSTADCLPGESSPPPPVTGHARSIWTSPFTLPSTTIKNTKDNQRNWSRFSLCPSTYCLVTYCWTSLAGTIFNVVVHHPIDHHDDRTALSRIPSQCPDLARNRDLSHSMGRMFYPPAS